MSEGTQTVKDKLEGFEGYRLAPVDERAAERSREAKRRQKERGVRFPDSTDIVRADRDSR